MEILLKKCVMHLTVGLEGMDFGAGGNIAVIDGHIDVHQASWVNKKKNQISQTFVGFNRKKKWNMVTK